jgi:hypothetical protein
VFAELQLVFDCHTCWLVAMVLTAHAPVAHVRPPPGMISLQRLPMQQIQGGGQTPDQISGR